MHLLIQNLFYIEGKNRENKRKNRKRKRQKKYKYLTFNVLKILNENEINGMILPFFSKIDTLHACYLYV